ncbi:MAG TPA: biopolymer transporter ExbD, partial [Flavobacteriaceae bacterium]|nr:biopolymer transporter ExbD [Flavobacteriaceae bacterium]
KYTQMKKAIDEGDITDEKRVESIQEKLQTVQDLIPLKLSEAEPKKSGS